MRKTFNYRQCEVRPVTKERALQAACNGGVNRYLTSLWLVTFPDGTWVLCGTKGRARSYIDSVIHRHLSRENR